MTGNRDADYKLSRFNGRVLYTEQQKQKFGNNVSVDRFNTEATSTKEQATGDKR
jgi:hypothetical protein